MLWLSLTFSACSSSPTLPPLCSRNAVWQLSHLSSSLSWCCHSSRLHPTACSPHPGLLLPPTALIRDHHYIDAELLLLQVGIFELLNSAPL